MALYVTHEGPDRGRMTVVVEGCSYRDVADASACRSLALQRARACMPSPSIAGEERRTLNKEGHAITQPSSVDEFVAARFQRVYSFHAGSPGFGA